MSVLLGNKNVTNIYIDGKAIVDAYICDKLVFRQSEGWWTRHKWLSLSSGTLNLGDVNTFGFSFRRYYIESSDNEVVLDRLLIAFIAYNKLQDLRCSINLSVPQWSTYDTGTSTGFTGWRYSIINGDNVINYKNQRLTINGNVHPVIFSKLIISSPVTKINSIVTDNCTFVPCQLLRTLPASKAWDGNSHSAGECGMWDTVSDKFYGNASSSGSFSVSDED